MVVKADELINDEIDIGGTKYTLRELALLPEGSLNGQSVTMKGRTTDLMLPSGEIMDVAGD